MKSKHIKRKTDIVTALIAVLICLLCVFALTACNSSADNESTVDREYELHFAGLSYLPDDGIVCAVVTLSGDETDKLDTVLAWHSHSYGLNIWYNRQDVELTVNPSLLHADVLGRMSEEQWVHDDVEYNVLKVVLRYDTIYKSINSDADSVVKSGRYYLHRFNIDEQSEAQTFAIWVKSQNTANWYTILIVCGIAFAAVLCGVVLLVKGGVWQKKKMKNE